MLKPFFYLFTFLGLSVAAAAQPTAILDRYIQEAMANNIALQGQQLSYEGSLAALREARSMFLPQLSIEARYSVARGGRAFVIPVGDLVNPIYDNLNLINGLGADLSPSYPDLPAYTPIDNVEENFLRQEEHETKLRLTMPVFNAAIIRNSQIQESLSGAERISLSIFRRELVRDVKVAYFNYLKATRAVSLYDDALALVEENLRTTRSLFDNNKVTQDVVYAAIAQVEEVKQQQAVAVKDEKVAQSYFNYLLNRPFEEEIEILADTDLPAVALTVEEAKREALQQREEFQQLNSFITASDQRIKLDRGNYLPQITLVADYGFQGTEYSFTGEDDYFQGSLVMSWNLFNQSTRHKIDQSRIEREKVIQQKADVERQVGLQVVQTYYDLEAAAKRINSARAEVDAARRALRLVQKKYAQGQVNLVAFTDARTQLTTGEQRLNIAAFDYQIKLAEFERATAGYALN